MGRVLDRKWKGNVMLPDKDELTHNAVTAALMVLDYKLRLKAVSTSPIGDKLAYDLDKRIRAALDEIYTDKNDLGIVEALYHDQP